MEAASMVTEVKNAPKGVNPLNGPTLVRYRDAARFLWGDDKSGQVADVIFGRNATISCLIFKLKPGGYFKSSDSWKSYFDQHRFYLVIKGEIAVHDPLTGEVALAKAGEAIHWRGAKWHFGYNLSSDECVVLDWYAPQERPPNVTELEFGATKPKFAGEKPGREDLLVQWPDKRLEEQEKAEREGGMIVVSRQTALHFVHGDRHPVLESLFVSTKELTAGTVELIAGARSDDREHPGHKIIFVLRGNLHIYLPDLFEWHELNEWDILYLPPAIKHQYWNYSGQPTSFAFKVVQKYSG
jgi:quercetin dioxygenase-like cupin family protein